MGKIRETIPVGFNHLKEKTKWDYYSEAPDVPIIKQELENSKYQLGTLGGGKPIASRPLKQR
jgi:tRNA-splicing ligase RtcB